MSTFEKKNQRVKIIAISTIAVIILILVIVLVVNLKGGDKGSDQPGNKKETSASSKAATTAVEQQTEIISTEIKYVYDNFTEIKVDAAKKTAAINYENKKDNNLYVKITIKMKSGGDVIYESPMLAPGDRLSTVNVNLPKDLSNGVYPIKVYIDSYKGADATESDQGYIQTINMTVG